MSVVKKSIGKVSCAVVGHEISEDEEDRLYIKPTTIDGIREMDSVCSRCGTKVHVKVDPTNEDEFFITEI
ncbi:MAG TPA: hypothetical protein VGR54_05540 [Nitrosopumilaceae archaeon]|nr:hypothetical protein [Nitrosopumilaceae archaeon]